MAPHVPRRRCVGCGRIAPKSELLRVAIDRTREGAGRTAVLDAAARMPGRGAYLCRAGGGELPASECVARASKQRAFARALRCAVTLDPKLVESIGR